MRDIATSRIYDGAFWNGLHPNNPVDMPSGAMAPAAGASEYKKESMTMKKILSLVLLLALVLSLSMVSLAEEVSPVVREKALDYFANYDGAKYVIKVSDLFAKMDAGEDMLILDIRQPDAYAQGHLIGAVNVPYGLTIAESLSLIPDDVQLYIYCYTGQTSSQVTALLNVAGKYAANIQSGFNNGISTTEGYEAYVTTDVAELPGDSYDVGSGRAGRHHQYFEEWSPSWHRLRPIFQTSSPRALLEFWRGSRWTITWFLFVAGRGLCRRPTRRGGEQSLWGGHGAELGRSAQRQKIIVYGTPAQTAPRPLPFCDCWAIERTSEGGMARRIRPAGLGRRLPGGLPIIPCLTQAPSRRDGG